MIPWHIRYFKTYAVPFMVSQVQVTASKISDLTEKVNAYDKDKVKSTDKDTINGLIADMTALINGNNLNDSEKTSLGNVKTTAESLIKKIDDTADEIKAVTDLVNGYNEDTVKSDDKQDIENLIKRIDTLAGTENVTETEKSSLDTVKTTAEELIEKIDNTAKKVTDLTEDVNAYDKDKVTSEDKQDIIDLIADIDKLLEEDNLNDSEKEELEKVKDTATALVERIEEAIGSTDTDNTDKVKDITSDNVETKDKSDLEKAKDDLEKALEDYKDNLTDDEKKDIQDEIDRIEKALEVIDKVEKVEDLINKLPANIAKSDADAIKKADEAYNALSKYEQSILDKNAKKKLDNAKSALEALNKATNSPATGDTGNIWMWFALLFVSGGGLLGTTAYRRKRKETEN